MAKLFLVVAIGAAVACGSSNEDGGGGGGQAATLGTGGTGGTGTGGSATGGSAGNATGGSATGGGGGGVTGGSGGTGTAGNAGSSGGIGGAGTGGSSASGGGGAGASGGGAGASGGSAGTTGYPSGPYGVEVGNTVENHRFNGYVNDAGAALSNTLALADYAFDDLRMSGANYALLHLSAFYCSGCRSAAIDLGALSSPVQQAGGRVIEVLFDGDLDPWISAYDLKVTTVAPQPGSTLVSGPADREHAFIVELSTMKIVWKAFGSYGTTTNSSAKQGLAEMQTLLGI